MSIDQLRQAYELIRQGQQQEAIIILQSVLQTDRNNPDAWWLLANAESDPRKQETALKEVLRLRPNDQRAQKMLGRVQAELSSAPDEFSFPVSDDDPFVSGRSSGDPFGSSEKPKRKPQYETVYVERRGRNPLVTCLAVVGVLTLACCFCTIFVVPRVATPIIEQISTQFPDIMLTLTAMPELQDMFGTLQASGAVEFESFSSGGNGAFDAGGANNRGTITPGQTVSGNVDTNRDDYYSLRVPGQTRITIDALSRGEVDPMLYVYDKDSRLIGQNDDGGDNRDARLTLDLSAGVYYVVVSAFSSGGEYEIRVSGS
jgi:hypothetical protein